MPQTTSPFTNPFLAVDAASCSRSTFIVPKNIISEIKKYESKDGVVQTTASILLTKFLHELSRLKLDTGDFAAYQSAVCNATITLNDANGKPIFPAGVAESGSTVVQPTTGSKRPRSRKAIG